jgi:hypothetical protein
MNLTPAADQWQQTAVVIVGGGVAGFISGGISTEGL